MRHGQSTTFLESGERRRQHIQRANSVKTQQSEFDSRSDALKHAKSFKYLGHWMGKDNHNGRAVRAELLKAR